MKALFRVAQYPLTSDYFDARLGQMICFLAAAALMPLAVLKLCSLALSEPQLVVGLFSAVACSLLLVAIGLLLPLSPGRRGGRAMAERGE